MKFGSVCSGIEAASVAWPFWDAAWFSEIEPFPCAVLKHHYPEVPNHGDMTTLPDRILSGEVEAPDIFAGGTPCQAFSVAGNRKSLDDARGNLSLTFCEIADAIDSVRSAAGKRPAVIFWENVPGCRNTKDNFFGCFLAKLCGATEALEIENGKWPTNGVIVGERRRVAWATLDARWFGLAQRRKRVFVVAYDNALVEHFGMPCPSEILSLGSRLPRNPTEGGKTRQGITADAESGIKWPADVASTLNAAFGSKQGLEDQHINGGAPLFVPHPVCAEISPTVTNGPPFSRTGNERVECEALVVSPPHAFKIRGGCEGGGKGYLGQDEQAFTITTGHDQQVAVPVLGFENSRRDGVRLYDGVTHTLQSFMGTGGGNTPCVTYGIQGNMIGRADTAGPQGSGYSEEVGYTLTKTDVHGIATQYAVRRLTPVECERLQGFSPVLEITRLIGCIDRQSKTVGVEIQCHKLQSSAWTAAESEYVQFANAADWSSNTSQASQDCHVALYAQSSFGALNQVLRKEPSEKSLCASNAEKQSWSRSHIQDASFAASLVPHLEKLAKEATNGKAALHQRILLSLADQHGNQSAGMFGGEITDIASDAKSVASVEKFTISHLGRVTPTCDSPIAISLCSVIHATSSFIQSETPMENFCIDLVLERDYTNIPWRNKPEAPDGPRYKALGNSWAVPVVRWIGERINATMEKA